jgi:hypothetical protein
MAKGAEQWLHYFHLERRLDRKAELLTNGCPGADTGTLAVEQLLAQESKERAAAFALAAFPAAAAGRLPVGAEGVNDLGRLAQSLLTVDGEIRWQGRLNDSTTHPELAAFARCSRLEPARRRVQQRRALLHRPHLSITTRAVRGGVRQRACAYRRGGAGTAQRTSA